MRAYENDRYCGMVMSTGFYHCFFKGLRGLYEGAAGKINIPKDLPVAIFSGSEDPVGNTAKELKDCTNGISPQA